MYANEGLRLELFAHFGEAGLLGATIPRPTEGLTRVMLATALSRVKSSVSTVAIAA